MHCRNGDANCPDELVMASCVSTQRLARLSKTTMGSPSLLVAHLFGRRRKTKLPGTGPSSAFPEALSKTAKDVFTHCTTCVVPTARLASLGRLSSTNVPLGPAKPCPTPSKFFPAVVETFGSSADCSARSGCAGILDRKSTRLNSSHRTISYAVFFLKKKST